MPKNAATSIQKSAPGPPVPMAVATPTMLPVPIVAESAVHSAPKWLTSPWASEPFSKWNMYLNARLRLSTCLNRSMTVSRIPVKRIAPMSGTPHTHPLAASTQAVSVSSHPASVIVSSCPVTCI